MQKLAVSCAGEDTPGRWMKCWGLVHRWLFSTGTQMAGLNVLRAMMSVFLAGSWLHVLVHACTEGIVLGPH